MSAAVLGVAALIAFVPNTGHTTATPIDPTKPAERYVVPKTVRATPAEKTAAEHTLAVFVPSAMTRSKAMLRVLLVTSPTRLPSAE